MSSKHTLAEHIKTHSDVRELFECDECGTKVKCQSTLIKHKKMHTDVQQTCGICFKVKPTELALKSHMRNVHGEANYKCTYCDKAFRRLMPLKVSVQYWSLWNMFTIGVKFLRTVFFRASRSISLPIPAKFCIHVPFVRPHSNRVLTNSNTTNKFITNSGWLLKNPKNEIT